MGFRSVLATEHTRFKISDEFRKKYNWLNIPDEDPDGYCYGPITSKFAVKFYDLFSETDIFVDLQKQLKGDELINTTLIHECGGITHIQIRQDQIIARDPKEWIYVDNNEHLSEYDPCLNKDEENEYCNHNFTIARDGGFELILFCTKCGETRINKIS